jgi:hypothetical protein
MKNTNKLLTLALVFVMLFTFAACGAPKADGIWDNALYAEDTTLGEGAKTVTVKVTADEKTVTFTIKTDKDILGDALVEHKLIEGEESQYGLMVLKVNGMTADYDIDQTYWAFYQNGEYMMSGVDTTEIKGGEAFEIVHSK